MWQRAKTPALFLFDKAPEALEWEAWAKISLLNRSNVWVIYRGSSPSGGSCVWSRCTCEWEVRLWILMSFFLFPGSGLQCFEAFTISFGLVWDPQGTKPRSASTSTGRYPWQLWLMHWEEITAAPLKYARNDFKNDVDLHFLEGWPVPTQQQLKNSVKVLNYSQRSCKTKCILRGKERKNRLEQNLVGSTFFGQKSYLVALKCWVNSI